MSVNHVISTRRIQKKYLKKIGFFNPFNVEQQKKGRKNPMNELHIELTLKIQIPEKGVKINNIVYQLKQFMAQLFFAILRAIFSALCVRIVVVSEYYP